MNQDELLQQYLQALEDGKPLHQILDELPAEERELGRLISLAAHARVTAHPELDPLKSQGQRGRVTASVQPNPRVTAPLHPDQRVTAAIHHESQITAAQNPDSRVTAPLHPDSRVTAGTHPNRRVTAPARRVTWGWLSLGVAGLAIFAVLAVSALASLAFLYSTAQSAQAATVMDVSGIVEAAPSADSSEWTILNDGDKVRQGAHLRTLSSSGVTLVFYDGSRTTLDDGTNITLTRVGGGWNLLSGRGLQVRYEQAAGLSQHSVVPLKGGSSFFEVLTPSGKATVHGTIFDVDVNSSGEARFAVSRGVVEVSHASAKVTLTAGQATLSDPEDAPLPPNYEFYVQGQISSIAGDMWTVNGLTFKVNPGAAGDYTFLVGDWVSVRGRILEDGSYVADRISPAHQEENKQRFSGVVESMGSDSWTISGKTVKIDEHTEIDDQIKVGDPVEVSFTVLEDGSWLAREISRTDDDEQEHPTRTPTATAETTETEEPSATATSTETETPTPEISPTVDLTGTATFTATPEASPTVELTPTPMGNRAGCDAADRQHPEGLRLAARWGVPYIEIMGWFCKGFGFGEIDLAYGLARQYGKPVSEIFAMKSAGMGWGNIKKALENGNQTNPQSTPGPKNKNNGNNNGNGNGNSNGKGNK